MRLTLSLLIACGLLLSCNQSDSTKVVTDATTETRQRDTAINKADRDILIQKLKQLQTVFASNDKEKIAALFPFPLSEKTVGIYIDDSSFNAQYEKNGNQVTRAMFIQYYRDISESLQIDQLNQLLKKVDVGKLLKKDTLAYEAIIKSEPCYHFYELKIEKDLVTLTVGTKSNSGYKSKSVTENEMPANSSEICEHVLWWAFRFDGNEFYLKEIAGAG
jgi:hypothetical protein